MSTQHKLAKNRSPRVNITYDMELGESSEKTELPFVLGVIGEFSKTDVPLKEREFISITKENFSSVMQGLNLSLAMIVDNKLIDNEEELLNVNLEFKSMDDFSPERISQQIEPLRNLVEARGKLSDLKSRVLSNERLREHLESIKEGNKDAGNFADDLSKKSIEEEIDKP
ncbi:type VI secretion system contractile sheath small subunit [Enterobacter ludwigii]|uniref:type VI secretion system contractile sheath small subunit n=1 Tax=Enterobacter ludwigii TaxID=299767 RepID=UPI003974AB68